MRIKERDLHASLSVSEYCSALSSSIGFMNTLNSGYPFVAVVVDLMY
jgi:hypothetical protein